MTFTVYFAGDLFDHKHLAGNELLAHLIESESQNRYRCALPQQKVHDGLTGIQVRNKDIRQLVGADFGLFNFDGTDLDSGTVVEYIIAKMLDIPSILLRTDIRSGGFGQFEGANDWNLMLAGYPRTLQVKHSSLFLYNTDGLASMQKQIARSIIAGFEHLMQEPSLLTSRDEMAAAYAHVAAMCGSGLSQELNPGTIESLVARKMAGGLYQMTRSAVHGQAGVNQNIPLNK